MNTSATFGGHAARAANYLAFATSGEKDEMLAEVDRAGAELSEALRLAQTEEERALVWGLNKTAQRLTTVITGRNPDLEVECQTCEAPPGKFCHFKDGRQGYLHMSRGM